MEDVLMRVLVCGSRTYTDDVVLDAVIYGLAEMQRSVNEPVTLITGAARGADSLAAETATALDGEVIIESYPAKWDEHGKAAGPIRNQQMLDEGKPEFVVAFVDKPLAESRGTADMVRRAQKAGLPVYVVQRIKPRHHRAGITGHEFRPTRA